MNHLKPLTRKPLPAQDALWSIVANLLSGWIVWKGNYSQGIFDKR